MRSNSPQAPQQANPPQPPMLLEVEGEQQQVIFQAASVAANMARDAIIGSLGPQASPMLIESAEALMASSPLTAALFSTLLNCHALNKSDRLRQEELAAARIGQAGQMPQSPIGLGPRI